MYSHHHRDPYAHAQQHHEPQPRPTLPPLSTYLSPGGHQQHQPAQHAALGGMPAHAAYNQHQHAPHYQHQQHQHQQQQHHQQQQQSLPSLSQLLSPTSNAYAQQQQQLLEQQQQQQLAYQQQQQGYALPVAHQVQQQQHQVAYNGYGGLSPSPAQQMPTMRYAASPPTTTTHQYYAASPASSSPPASPTAGTPTAARPFACDRCQAGFSRPHDLKRHRASVHFRNDAEGPTCPKCARPFSRPDALRRHAQRGCHAGEDLYAGAP